MGFYIIKFIIVWIKMKVGIIGETRSLGKNPLGWFLKKNLM